MTRIKAASSRNWTTRLSIEPNSCAASQSKRGRYVILPDDELKSFEAQGDHAIEISEFIPLSEVDPVYFENGYYLGCDGSAKSYRLLADAMAQSARVALANYTMR